MILVTGASGALGGLIVKALAGHDVIAGTRGEWAGPGPSRRVDFDDPASLPAAFEGVSTLVFVSAGYAEDDVVFARHKAVADAAARAGVRHVIYTSLTGSASSMSIALAHRYTEKVLAGAPFAVTVLRNALYAELLAGLAAPALESGVLPGPLRDGRVPLVAREDLAEAAARVAVDPAPHAGRVYELDGVEELGLEDLAALLPGLRDGESLGALRESLAGFPGYQSGHTVSIFAAISGGLVTRGESDLPELLGREPRPVRPVVAAALGS
ncbi:NAD(P)-dependent oxidoreductase [Actinorhabdospora filicis]|uniref:NAD(P)-dependent oxidoreductase n=1 Tax=Actinorhabdospora filicis TaxID=1785913 RepID=A0A9W6SSJ0_9ACTN|nr:NmrA family NAD(P)-binding protein [Actinorhabdospora filicis]GLZ81174.1 NAD(P)-dependent oxidoreductase [Actinorhabdospora filicis]